MDFPNMVTLRKVKKAAANCKKLNSLPNTELLISEVLHYNCRIQARFLPFCRLNQRLDGTKFSIYLCNCSFLEGCGTRSASAMQISPSTVVSEIASKRTVRLV